MSFIKFGNHVIAPAGAEPTPLASTTPPSNSSTDVLSLARILQAKLKDLEVSVAERKARRQEWRAGVSRLDKMLVALREQDSKEGEKLNKLSKRWNKTCVGDYHDRLEATSEAQRYMFGVPRDNPREERFVCPTNQAASAFNGSNERHRDSYFFGPGWSTTPACTPAPSSPFSSAPSSPAGYRMSSFQFTTSPEEMDTRERYGPDITLTKREGQNQHPGHRAALSDILNTPQDAGESKRRKRKTADLEEADGYDGPYKRIRGAETGSRHAGRMNPRRGSEMEY